MLKIFYDHLVIREDVITALDAFSLDPREKEELVRLVDSHLHHHILNVILNHLPKDKHPEFMNLFIKTPHDRKLLDYLKTHISIDIESQITTHAVKVKKEILEDIRKSRRSK